MIKIDKACFLFSLVFFTFHSLFAQQKKNEKYPSLLWEITGKGMKKPSYLFGTMHVSNKMVFHLGDSFYNAIRNTETVALELNPDLWQGQMVQLEKQKERYTAFTGESGNNYITENSFRLYHYLDEIKLALQTEPAIVNNLLYRSYKSKEDFEEDTFLDLYIFQTGRKLGKKAAGVENFYESEKLVMEAYTDMAREKKKKTVDLGEESSSDIMEKMQQAYRRGDLDLMDSLDVLMERSTAFREKFLYKRNELQASAMDSIMQKNALFVGVGAAHLPGKRGVIELLRNMGYQLRPVKMANHNTEQKSIIDNLTVPVVFEKKFAEDQFYSVDVPGDLNRIRQDYQNLDRRQFADMGNGSYYMVTRVKTHAAILNETEQDVFKKVDSILYENIPGKILSRSVINKNGYKGFDVLSRTRRGNVQRYQLFITPFEVLIFKMSGKENYVQGKEAGQYFSSIRLKETEQKGLDYLPAQGGFGIKLPHYPLATMRQDDIGKRWEFEALDEATGNAYLVIKKSIVNYNFIDEDSFDLQLAEESFRNPDLFEKQISRKLLVHKGFPALEVKEQLKNGAIVNILYLINGPHFYVIAQKQGKQNSIDHAYFESFRFLPYEYPLSGAYTDTFLKFSVQTPVEPKIDEGIRVLIESALESAATANGSSGYFSYWPKPRYGVFASDSTGEMVTVKVQEYPAYFYARDSAKFWQNEIDDLSNDHDLMIADPVSKIAGKDFSGIRFSFKDTGSCRKIAHMIIIKNNYQYTITVMGDSISVPGSFTTHFFNSMAPLQQKVTGNIWKNKLHEYFNDLFSKDSIVYNRAFQSITSIYYGPEAIPLLRGAISKLNIKDKNYFEIKRKLIAELGYIKDSVEGRLEMQLRNIFDQAADTSLFQNEVIKALGRVKTKKSYSLLKEIFLQDPPVFENSSDYNSLFESLEDSLALSAPLFPELLQLTSLDDYKEPITSLLVSLVDSGLVKPETYAGYFSAIYIDAKINLKKQQGKEEKLMQEVNKKEADGDDEPERKYHFNNKGSALDHSSILLMPFYDKNKNVQQFFLKLLQSKEEEVKMNAAVLMLRNNKPFDDSILLSLAAADQYRCLLYTGLEKIRRLDQFPEKFNRQDLLARSFLAEKNEYDKMDSIVFLSKQPASVKGKKGVVYFFKYRVLKEDQWKIGISGLQPENEKEISTKDELTILTDVSLKENEPMAEQLNKQLKKILFGLHKSGKYFYNDYSGSGNIHALSAYED